MMKWSTARLAWSSDAELLVCSMHFFAHTYPTIGAQRPRPRFHQIAAPYGIDSTNAIHGPTSSVDRDSNLHGNIRSNEERWISAPV
jgi:hypothetical protein